jgi:predicted amidophosphoribosyltransferase
MASATCPKCSGPLSDSIVNCPYCGYGITSHFEREREERKKQEAEEKFKLSEMWERLGLCNKCGGNLVENGTTYYIRSGKTFQNWRCTKCGYTFASDYGKKY